MLGKDFDHIKKSVKLLKQSYGQDSDYVILTDYSEKGIPPRNKVFDKNGEKIIKINAFCEILENPPNPEKGITEWTEWTGEMKREFERSVESM